MATDNTQHLEFIQNNITRMNSNSFYIKGLDGTIITALLAIYASNANILIVYVGIVPTIVFWFLDAYYLQTERKFRGVYNNVAGIEKNIDILPYDMPIDQFTGKEYCFFRAFWSKTIVWFYGIIILLLVLIGFVVKIGCFN